MRILKEVSQVNQFLPQTGWQRCVTLALAVLIIGAGSIVAGKALHNRFLSGKWAWEERAIRFPLAPVDRAGVERYGAQIEQAKLPEGSRAKFTFEVKMPDGAWCKTSHVTTGASMWSFTLAVMNLDGLLLNIPVGPPLPGVSTSASACGGSASISCTKAAMQGPSPPPPSWSPEEQAAWTEWAVGASGECFGFLFAATVTAGGMGGETQTQFRVFGYTSSGSPPTGIWHGDTGWSLAGTLSIANLRLRMAKSEDSVGIYTVPRRWDDFQGSFGWFATAEPPTTTVATLGGMSVSYVVDLDPDPITGQVDFNATPILPSHFFSTIGYGPGAANYALNTSYAEVQSIVCSVQGVAPNCYNSFWSTYVNADDPSDWTVGVDPPEGAIWHAFNVGNTMKMHIVAGGGTAPTGFSWRTWMDGPVKLNMMAGRGGHGDAFPVASGWRADFGITRYITETETEIVWVYEGESPWYVTGYTSKATDQGQRLSAGSILFGTIIGTVDEAWLTANGELLTLSEIDGEPVPEIDNRRVKMLLASLVDPLSGNYWGPVINLVHTEISADIPPGYAERPSSWVAGAGATIDPEHNERWTITGATGAVSRALLSRYDARLGYLATGYQVGGVPYIDDWIMIARANIFLPQDPPEVAAVCEVEDVTNYDNSRCLVLTFADYYPRVTDLPEGWQEDVTLKLNYATYTLEDWCWTPAEYAGIDLRFGEDGFFTFERTDHEAIIPGEQLVAGVHNTGLKFDLGRIRRYLGHDLRHVTAIQISGLPQTVENHEFRLADMRLQKDPDSHGV